MRQRSETRGFGHTARGSARPFPASWTPRAPSRSHVPVTPPAFFGPRELHSHDTATPAPCAPTPMRLAHLDDQQSDNARQSRPSPTRLARLGTVGLSPMRLVRLPATGAIRSGKTDHGRAQRGYHEVAD